VTSKVWRSDVFIIRGCNFSVEWCLVEKFDICTFRFTAAHLVLQKKKNALRPPGDALVCAHKSKESLASWLASRDERRVHASSRPLLGIDAYFCRELGKVCQASRPHFNSHTVDRLFICTHRSWCICMFALRFNCAKLGKNSARTHTRAGTPNSWPLRLMPCKRRNFWAVTSVLQRIECGVNYNKHYSFYYRTKRCRALPCASSRALCFTVFFLKSATEIWKLLNYLFSNDKNGWTLSFCIPQCDNEIRARVAAFGPEVSMKN